MNKLTKPVACCSLFVSCLLGSAALLEAETIAVPPPAFRPSQFFYKDWRIREADVTITKKNDNAMYFIAPLNLPDGVTLKKLTAVVTDNAGGAGNYVKIYIRRDNRNKGQWNILVMLSSKFPPSSTRQILTGTISRYGLVDNTQYNYSIVIHFIPRCDPWKIFVHGAQIDYERPLLNVLRPSPRGEARGMDAP